MLIKVPHTCRRHDRVACRSRGRVRQLDIEAVDEGAILIDSGSTAHVSGPSPFFQIVKQLETPVSLTLAIPTKSALVSYVGRLNIPTRTGNLTLNHVFYCEGVKGSIISTGRLVTEGWRIHQNGTSPVIVD